MVMIIFHFFHSFGDFCFQKLSKANTNNWKRRKTEAEEKSEEKVEEPEEIEDPLSWYFNWTVDQPADKLETAKESIQQVQNYTVHIL